MFERFTERARRVIFFARYEAGTLGSAWIETEHLLLGLIRGDSVLPNKLSIEALKAIRKRIEGQCSPTSIPSSVDLPLSYDSKQVLSFGAEESDKLHHNFIDTGHFVLGLLRIECLATTLLRQHGIGYESYRETIQVPTPHTPADVLSFDPWQARPQREGIEAAPPGIRPALRRLQGIVDATLPHLAGYSDADKNKSLKRMPWTRKEALGHLVDYASSHQQWFARALTESRIDLLSYPQEGWVAAQHYRDFSWPDLMELWVLLNRLVIHALTRMPEEKLNTPCRIGVEAPIPLSSLVKQYVHHCEDVAGQILAH